MRLGYLAACLGLGLAELSWAGVTVLNENGVEYVKEWETPQPNEKVVNDNLAKFLSAANNKNYKEKGLRTLRDAHPGSLGCIQAKFSINDTIDEDFKLGMFQPGKTYDAIIRLSSAATPPDPDSKPGARGFAMKIFGVPGKKIPAETANATTHDIIMLSYPGFVATNPEDFLNFILTLTKFGGPQVFYFPSLHPDTWKVRNVVTSVGINSRAEEASLVDHRQFFSGVPYLLGDRPVKYGAISCDYANDKLARPANPSPSFLRDQLKARLAENSACFDFMIQRYKRGFVIEDGMAWWPSGSDNYTEPKELLRVQSPGDKPTSPFVKIARIIIPKQVVDLDPASPSNIFCDNLSMNPFHALPEHRPLGAINRARRFTYDVISGERHKDNGVPEKEPTSISEFTNLK